MNVRNLLKSLKDNFDFGAASLFADSSFDIVSSSTFPGFSISIPLWNLYDFFAA